MFVFKKQVREIVLHATVVDETDGSLLVSTAATGGSAFFPRAWTKSARSRERWPTTFAVSTPSHIRRKIKT